MVTFTSTVTITIARRMAFVTATLSASQASTPCGIRTRVVAVRGRYPRPSRRTRHVTVRCQDQLDTVRCHSRCSEPSCLRDQTQTNHPSDDPATCEREDVWRGFETARSRRLSRARPSPNALPFTTKQAPGDSNSDLPVLETDTLPIELGAFTFFPVELAMAVRTENLALLDFLKDASLTPAVGVHSFRNG